MTDRKMFEQMLQHLINEDKSKAEELFHDLVVSKSREIYENLLDDDIQVDEEADDDEDEDDEEVDENFDYGLGEVGPGDPSDNLLNQVGPDDEGSEDDMGGDMGDDDMGGEDPATKDDVMDIKDALEELKAEFEAMLSGKMDDDMGDDDMGDDDMGDDEDDETKEDYAFESDDDEEDDDEVDEDMVREYVEKVNGGGLDSSRIGGDNGVGGKSIVAGKNDMGGTTANIARGGTSTTGGTKGGLAAPTTKEHNAGNVNVPGGKAGVKHLSKQPGHGAEKKGTGDMGDRSAQSPLNGAPRRAK